MMRFEDRAGSKTGAPRRRWIVIGSVKRNWFVIRRNAGFPWGIYMHWMGRTHVFQPFEFLNWHELMPEIHHRLQMAGLSCVSVALEAWPQSYLYHRVFVEVERATRHIEAPHPGPLPVGRGEGVTS
jgi:hypothetical protein